MPRARSTRWPCCSASTSCAGERRRPRKGRSGGRAAVAATCLLHRLPCPAPMSHLLPGSCRWWRPSASGCWRCGRSWWTPSRPGWAPTRKSCGRHGGAHLPCGCCCCSALAVAQLASLLSSTAATACVLLLLTAACARPPPAAAAPPRRHPNRRRQRGDACCLHRGGGGAREAAAGAAGRWASRGGGRGGQALGVCRWLAVRSGCASHGTACCSRQLACL